MEPDIQENNPTETTKIEIAASKLKKYQYAMFGLVGLILLVFIVLFFLAQKPTTDSVRDALSESVQESTENLNTNPFSFSQRETGVEVLDANGEIIQTIELANIEINNPKSSFVEVYGSEQSMERMGETVPAILENFDLNHDGINDIGILVDTGPIEPGYVFYISNDIEKEDSTSAFHPAKLGYHVSTGPFVVYAPSMIQDGKILQGKFTVTNPQRMDYSYYVYDSKTGMFFDTDIDIQGKSEVVEVNEKLSSFTGIKSIALETIDVAQMGRFGYIKTPTNNVAFVDWPGAEIVVTNR